MEFSPSTKEGKSKIPLHLTRCESKGKTMGTNKKLALSVAAAAAIIESNKKIKGKKSVKSKNSKKRK